MIIKKTKSDIQIECLKELLKYHRCSASMSMGSGKTLIGLQHMENEYNQNARFLVVAPAIAIFQSWIDDANKFNLSYLLKHITFSTYLSINKHNPDDYDVVYLDECHNLLYTHKPFLDAFKNKIIGLTGTPPRYKNSEKGEMVHTYCPIVYKYITDTAIDDGIINDYKIFVHKLNLSTSKTFKVKTKNNGFFMTSEVANYIFWSTKIDNTNDIKQKQQFRIMRMRALMGYDTKEIYTKLLLTKIKNKCIVFCNTTEQADKICKYSHHSKNDKDNKNLNLFKEGKIDKLSCVQQLNEGQNIPGLKSGVIMHSFSNERKSQQKLGRLLRLIPEDTATLHILMYKNTIDETWVSEALKDLDQSKITYIDAIK